MKWYKCSRHCLMIGRRRRGGRRNKAVVLTTSTSFRCRRTRRHHYHRFFSHSIIHSHIITEANHHGCHYEYISADDQRHLPTVIDASDHHHHTHHSDAPRRVGPFRLQGMGRLWHRRHASHLGRLLAHDQDPSQPFALIRRSPRRFSPQHRQRSTQSARQF